MQLEAIYDHGHITFTRPIRLAQERFPVLIELPDTALNTAEPPTQTQPSVVKPPAAATDLLTEIRQVLGPLNRQRTAVSAAEDKQALTEILAEKYAL
jgi:hypothetical protein